MTRKLLLGALAALALAAPASAAAETVDIGLVIDGSGSIDSRDWALQREGFSTALRDPANVPLDGSVAISVVQFSSGTQVEVPRTVIDSQATLDGVVQAIEGMRQRNGGTDPQTGITAGVAALAPLREDAKSVLCLSSDGTGGSLTSSVAAAKAAGIQRLSVIGIDDGGNTQQLRSYYGPHVFGGGAMTIARNTAEFATLIAGSCFGDAVTLRALEVNQGAQDWRNSKTLLQLRETVVRAFVETPAGAPDERVTGRLIGRRNGVELPGSPLAATNTGGSVLARNDIEARRGTIADSLNFELPLSWVTGSAIELEFEAGGAPVDCKEPADPGTPANDCRVAPSLAATTTLGVAFYAIDIDGDGPSWGDMAEQIARVQSALPVSIFNRSQRTLAYEDEPSIDDVNGDLHRIREVERTSCATSGCAIPVRDIFYGLIAGGPLGGLNGKANGIPGDAATSVTNNLDNPTSTGYARNTVVHELSHSLGVHHAVDNALGVSGGFLWWGGHKTGRCGEVASRSAPGHSPFVTVGGRIRPALGPISGADDEVWGLDHRFARVNESGLGLSDPERVWALMSYCNDGAGQRRWPSAFERDQQIAGLRALQARAGGGGGGSWETGEVSTQAQVVTPPAGSRGVLISGTVDASTKTATVESALPLPYAGDAAPGEGTFTLRVEGAGGTVLAEREFTPLVGFGEGEEDGLKATFAQAVAIPEDAEIERVVVVSDADGPLGTRAAATGPAPEVSDVTISDASIGADPVTLRWKRTPGTRAAVLFSPDDGKSWRPLTFRQTGESFEIDPATLAGTPAGRFAVAVTDGLRGAVAQLPDSVNVTVGNAVPTVEITSPRPDDPSPSGVQPILFTAVAGDRDQVLADSAIVWRSDRDGVLGSGPTLTRTADTLTEGLHTITVTVTDDEGATATASVQLEVFRVPPPPPSADKTLTARGPAGDVTGGSVTTVVASVSNAGPSRSRELRLTGSFPEGTTPRVPADLQGWECSVSGRELVCLRDGLLPAEATELQIGVAVADVAARTTRTVTFAVDAAVADPRPQDDRATVSFDVVPRPAPTATPTPAPSASPAPQPSAPSAPSASASTAPPARALNLRVRQGRAQLLTNKLDVSVVARCAVACTAEARGSVKIGRRTWQLKRAKAQIAEGRSARLRLASSKALRRAARAALRRSKLRVTVTVRVRGADGATATRRVRVPIRTLR